MYVPLKDFDPSPIEGHTTPRDQVLNTLVPHIRMLQHLKKFFLTKWFLRFLKIFLIIYFCVKIWPPPPIVAPPYPQGSWFESTWIYSTWGCFHTIFSFSEQRVFKKIFLKHQQIFINSKFVNFIGINFKRWKCEEEKKNNCSWKSMTLKFAIESQFKVIAHPFTFRQTIGKEVEQNLVRGDIKRSGKGFSEKYFLLY